MFPEGDRRPGSGGFAAAVPAAASATAAVRARRTGRRGTTPTVLRRDEASANARYVVSGAHVLRQRLAAADSAYNDGNRMLAQRYYAGR